MNTFVLLLMTTCVPSLDPVPVADSTPSYGQDGSAGRNSGGRHRFFGRIRGLFTHRSRGNNSSNPTNPKEAPATGVVTSTPPALPASGEVVPTQAIPTIIRPAPTTFSPGVAPPQRMPVGTPLPQSPSASPY